MSDLQSTRLRDLQAAVNAGNTAALDSFWTEIELRGAPIVERAAGGDCYVTFVWRDDGTTRSVDVIQDWGADGIREHPMARLSGTDVWYLTRRLPPDTRTTYQLAPEPLPAGFDGSVPYLPDPLNRKRFLTYFDESGFELYFSLLALPDAPAQRWTMATATAGDITLHAPFEDGRRIWVYMPAAAAPPPYSLLVAFDGRLAIDLIGVPDMLNVLIHQREIRPTVAVFIDNPDRDELACDPDFARYVVRRVVPWARATFPVTDDPRRTVVMGTSYGGLCAAYLGLYYPDVFGAVLSQTGWFRWRPDGDPEHGWLARQVIARPRQRVRFYMDVGVLETARMADGGPTQLAANRHMRDVLLAKGYEVIYREYSGGHDASSTQTPLFDALPLLLA